MKRISDILEQYLIFDGNIIVPDSYYTQVDKRNEIIVGAGGKKLDYAAHIKTCFDKAYETQVIRQEDVKKKRNANAKMRKATAKPEAEGEN